MGYQCDLRKEYLGIKFTKNDEYLEGPYFDGFIKWGAEKEIPYKIETIILPV